MLNRKDILLLYQTVRLPVALLLLTLFGGTAGYQFFYPESSWTELFFMTAITLSTVGYSDFLNVYDNPAAMWYTMVLIIAGMGIVLYSVTTLTAFVIEGNIGKLLWRRRMEKEIAALENHYIVCGAGQTGIHAVHEVVETGHKCLIIEDSEERREKAMQRFPKTIIVEGDATSDEELINAGIERARGLIATLSNDKDNLFLTLTARLMNSNLYIVSRAIDPDIKPKLLKAGANSVVSPNQIGGLRIASEMLRPHVVNFLDRMLRGKNPVRVEEARMPLNSPQAGKRLKDLHIPSKTGLLIVAYSADDQPESFIYNPGPDLVVEPGSVMYFIGNPDQQHRLEKILAGND